VPIDFFSVRWTRNAWLQAGTYRVSVDVDDGIRLWIDGALLIDAWHESGGQYHEIDVGLPEGAHAFQVEFLEMAHNAHIHLSMATASGRGTSGTRWKP
jgi:hypothetical protein